MIRSTRGAYLLAVVALLVACAPGRVVTGDGPVADSPGGSFTPLEVGETALIHSAVLGEDRRINVYVPPGYAADPTVRLPVLYMPDGGIHEDFLHIAGLLQISIANGTMRPFLLVGIENTQRRRDLTGPTGNEEDRTIAPEVGGSAAFRSFLRSELIPFIDGRYRTTGERGIVGESLAGLFVVETLLLEPELFDTYIAIDPSLWWNDGGLVDPGSSPPLTAAHRGRVLYLASSGEPELARLTRRLAESNALARAGVVAHYRPMPMETHATIYHPAAITAFRALFRP